MTSGDDVRHAFPTALITSVGLVPSGIEAAISARLSMEKRMYAEGARFFFSFSLSLGVVVAVRAGGVVVGVCVDGGGTLLADVVGRGVGIVAGAEEADGDTEAVGDEEEVEEEEGRGEGGGGDGAAAGIRPMVTFTDG